MSHNKIQDQEEDVVNKNKKNIDNMLTNPHAKTSAMIEENKVSAVQEKTDNKVHMIHTSANKQKDKSFFKEHGVTVVILAFVLFISILHFSKKSNTPKGEIDTRYKYKTEIVNSLEDQMGWGKAPKNIQIQPINLRIGKMVNKYSDTFTYPTPVVELSIKNTGSEKLNSFGIYWEVKDIDNKRRVGGTGVASGSIDPGWSSEQHVLTLPPTSFSKIMGGNYPINFRMLIHVYIPLRSGNVIDLYNDIITPEELGRLPTIKY